MSEDEIEPSSKKEARLEEGEEREGDDLGNAEEEEDRISGGRSAERKEGYEEKERIDAHTTSAHTSATTAKAWGVWFMLLFLSGWVLSSSSHVLSTLPEETRREEKEASTHLLLSPTIDTLKAADLELEQVFFEAPTPHTRKKGICVGC